MLFFKMQNKKCKKCSSKKVIKDWKMRGKQRYKCKKCWYVFQNKTRNHKKENIRKEYSDKKQTYSQISTDFWISIRTVQRKIDEICIKKKRTRKES